MGKEKMYKINPSSLLSLFMSFSPFPQNMFPSKMKYSLMQEYVTNILAGSLFFCSKIFRITHDLMQKTNNCFVVLLVGVFQSFVFSWQVP